MLTNIYKKTNENFNDISTAWLGNFEVEANWGVGETKLPSIKGIEDYKLVNQMSELAVWLTKPHDIVFLPHDLDSGFLEHIRLILGHTPEIFKVPLENADKITDSILYKVQSGLLKLPERVRYLATHGTSCYEEKLAEELGVELATPQANICRRVNSKIYSRKIAGEEGILQPVGCFSESVGDLGEVFKKASYYLSEGPIVIKEAYGVSGKGLIVVNSISRLQRLFNLLQRSALKNKGHAKFCVEQWVNKATDINYQFHVDENGISSFDFVKEAITQQGVHLGHIYPSRIEKEQYSLLQSTAEILAERLSKDGFRGVVGVDALITTEGELYPLIEINARLNMSSYQEPIRRNLGAEHIFAWHEEVKASNLKFEQIADLLGENLAFRGSEQGVTVLANGTSNISNNLAGRLFLMAHAPSEIELTKTVKHTKLLLSSSLNGKGK